MEWGAVIHRMLQVAMRDPRTEADLAALATSALAEGELDPDLAETAASVVRSVMRSELWARARQSERWLVEVPFTLLIDRTGEPASTVVRGVIDLAFREASGWVLVDYKTDPLRGRSLDALVRRHAPQVRLYARAWEQCTKEPVRETGLYFTEGDLYRVV
jgi:ATP-dependent helicase/nuclease subunit A